MWKKVAATSAAAATMAMGAVLVIDIGDPGDTCEWPDCFPDASTTGVTDEGALTTVSGNVTLSTNGQTYQDKLVNGCITVTGSGVTIRNVRVECPSGTAQSPITYIDPIGYDDTPLLVEDVELDCNNRAGSHGFEEGNATLRRVEIRNCENGISVNQKTTLVDSWIYDLAQVGGDPHEDGVQFGCGHYTGNPADHPSPDYCEDGTNNLPNYDDGSLDNTITHNRIEGITNLGNNATSAIITNPDRSGPDTNLLIEHNLLDGGGTTVYCPRDAAGSGTYSGVNVQVKNNSFTENGVNDSEECADETSSSGNIRHETGNPITLD